MKLFCPICEYPHEVSRRLPKGKRPACPHHGREFVTARELKALQVQAEVEAEMAEDADEAPVGTPGNPRQAPFARNDHLTPHFDYAAGAKFNSKSQREAYCKANGLVLRSHDEHLRNESHNHSKPRAMSYRGQKSRRSSAEKRGIVDGHAVL